MTRKIILVSCFLVFVFTSVRADCLACWKLEHVEIEYNSGETRSGYFKWSNIWVKSYFEQEKHYELASSFCDTLALYFNSRNQLFVDTAIILEDVIGFETLLSIAKSLPINLEDVRHIRRSHGKYSDREGAGPISRISRMQLSLLMEQSPNAILKTAGWGLSTAYYISFDNKVGQKQLREIAEARKEETLFDDKIILIEIHYD